MDIENAIKHLNLKPHKTESLYEYYKQEEGCDKWYFSIYYLTSVTKDDVKKINKNYRYVNNKDILGRIKEHLKRVGDYII